MANKADKFYFENLIKAAEQSCRAAEYLAKLFKSYMPEKLGSALSDMHEIEHTGDGIKHEMTSALAKAFVTPVDREDIALISQRIDNVTDSIEDVLQRFYVDQIQSILPEAVIFADKLVECCDLMIQMLKEFENFKKPEKLRELVIALNHAESECDSLYLSSVLAVRKHCTDVLDIMFWREIYDCLEACADACEDVGDCVEMVVMKNT